MLPRMELCPNASETTLRSAACSYMRFPAVWRAACGAPVPDVRRFAERDEPEPEVVRVYRFTPCVREHPIAADPMLTDADAFLRL